MNATKRQRNLTITCAVAGGMTYAAVSKQYGLSKERTRQIVQIVLHEFGLPALPYSIDDQKK